MPRGLLDAAGDEEAELSLAAQVEERGEAE
jgi:hypothetical protein